MALVAKCNLTKQLLIENKFVQITFLEIPFHGMLHKPYKDACNMHRTAQHTSDHSLPFIGIRDDEMMNVKILCDPISSTIAISAN